METERRQSSNDVAYQLGLLTAQMTNLVAQVANLSNEFRSGRDEQTDHNSKLETRVATIEAEWKPIDRPSIPRRLQSLEETRTSVKASWKTLVTVSGAAGAVVEFIHWLITQNKP